MHTACAWHMCAARATVHNFEYIVHSHLGIIGRSLHKVAFLEHHRVLHLGGSTAYSAVAAIHVSEAGPAGGERVLKLATLAHLDVHQQARVAQLDGTCAVARVAL